ncbi:MAG: tetratricopeptide repeat protein [Oscillatoria sp. PMC 1051.18]|nr:tetratricopeptide repeat protein [Oscillatoria sp. PMC 1050.18]MEC5030959.1 tetratricopeptide repeat protein [Oscillatoria sp. PMC 1051.18]
MSEVTSSDVSQFNQQTYQRLSQALGIGLRRQIFMVVCDDFGFREILIQQLDAQLKGLQLVTLELDLDNPNIVAQIGKWLKKNKLAKKKRSLSDHLSPTLLPHFQIVGVERLVRQSPAQQQRFLRSLQSLERYLPRLEANLLFWLPCPWLNMIRQSVPEFWRWHTGIFIFQADPTPVDLELSRSTQVRESKPDLNLDWESTQVDSNTIAPLAVAQEDISVAEVSVNTEEETSVSVSLPQLDSLEDVAQLLEQSYSQNQIATALMQLGNKFREFVAAGDASQENLATAIQAYSQALEWAEDDFPHTPEILNDLGNIFWMMSRQTTETTEKLAFLEQAIQAYQFGLTRLTAETAPQIYAMIQNNLGAAYGDLARYQDTTVNLQLAIRAYEDALHYRSPQEDPLKYGSTQNNLGTAYWNLAQKQNSPANLQSAIAAYNEALAQYSPDRTPTNWATIQNNLGTAYWNLAQYEQPEIYLRVAIDSYQNALEYRNSETAPAACAATQNNLATAYWHLATKVDQEPETKQEYLQSAIANYEATLILALRLTNQDPPVKLSFDLKGTYNNLGSVLYQLGNLYHSNDLERQEYFIGALQAHLEALDLATPDTGGYKLAFNYIIRIVRTLYQEFGVSGQNLALAVIPAQLLPEILPKL